MSDRPERPKSTEMSPAEVAYRNLQAIEAELAKALDKLRLTDNDLEKVKLDILDTESRLSGERGNRRVETRLLTEQKNLTAVLTEIRKLILDKIGLLQDEVKDAKVAMKGHQH